MDGDVWVVVVARLLTARGDRQQEKSQTDGQSVVWGRAWFFNTPKNDRNEWRSSKKIFRSDARDAQIFVAKSKPIRKQLPN